MAKGLTNADFASLFRKESRANEHSPIDTSTSLDEETEPVNPMMEAAMRRNFAEEETWDENDPPRGGLGSAPQFEPEETRAAKVSTADENKKGLSEAELRKKFTWQKHTTGFGMKMMAKMGFSGRLGKDEKGVSATVEVVQRPNQMGLGFGSFKEAGNLKHNKRIEKELKGETYDEKEEQEQQKQERDAVQEDDSLWRKRKLPTGRKTYKMASEVSHEAHSKKPRNEIILDMRGPDVRVLDRLKDAYIDQDKIDSARPKLGEELIYNVRMVVNLAQGRIYDLTQKIDTNTATTESMEKEAKILRAQVESDSLRWLNVEQMMEKMKKLEAVAASATESLSTEYILQSLRDLRACHPREFEAYKIAQIVPSLVIPPVKALLLSSDMLNENSLRLTLQQFQQIQLFLLESPEISANEPGVNSFGVFRHIREKSSSVGDGIYNYILEEALWPGAVQMVNIHWNVKTDPTGCVVWYNEFKPHLSDEFASAFLHQLVLPRLKKECQQWNPTRDTTFMHEWLQPWAQHLGGALDAVNPDVQLSLGNALSQWHPSDLSVLPVIAPWRSIWGETEFGKFTHRHILRKLIRCLHREFQVDPQNQSLDALRWVLAWQNYLPERQFVALFEGEFFPKWLSVLRRWVMSSPDLTELETWYVGWKMFFTKHQLATEPRLVVHFHGALVLLQAAAQKELDASLLVPDLNRLAPSSYQEALVKAKEHDSGGDDSQGGQTSWQQAEAPKQARKSHRPAHGVNLKDVVEHLAIENDLDFMPKGRHDGQQVYVFGKHHILIEQGVVYAEKGKGDFQPVDIEDLIRQ